MSDDIIIAELSKFMISNGVSEAESGPLSLSNVDDIVMSYIKGVLEEVVQDDDINSFDAEDFMEVMTAYIPEFGETDSSLIYDWLFQLADKLREKRDVTSESKESVVNYNPEPSEENLTEKKPFNTSDSNSFCEISAERKSKVDLLSSIFPGVDFTSLSRALRDNGWDIEESVNILLATNLEKTTLTSKSKEMTVKHQETKLQEKKDELKKSIISKYSLVDTKSDKTFHKPCAPKQDSKKMVRYRDGKVVSTRGEKFYEEKKEDSEEMKKTFINLKPARKYRFH